MIPPGYTRQRSGLLVREGCAAEVAMLLAAEETAGTVASEGGRGTARRHTLPDGRVAWVRAYRHGGLFGRLLGGFYFGWPSRSERELCATEAARRAGLIAPEILAAETTRRGPLYRGRLVTRGVEGHRSLRAVLLEVEDETGREAWLAAVVRDVVRLHRGGVHHPDLNPTNLLAGASPDEAIAFLDFDRGRVFPHAVGGLWRRLAHRRLVRSFAKLQLPGFSAGVLAGLLRPVMTGEIAMPGGAGGAGDGDPASSVVRKRRER
jgi:hypothetical protein